MLMKDFLIRATRWEICKILCSRSIDNVIYDGLGRVINGGKINTSLKNVAGINMLYREDLNLEVLEKVSYSNLSKKQIIVLSSETI